MRIIVKHQELLVTTFRQRWAEEKEMLNGAIRVTTQGKIPIESFVKMPKETVTAISPTQKFRLQNSLRGFKRVPIAGSPQWMRIGQRHEGWMEVGQRREYRTVTAKFLLPEVDNPGFDKCLGSRLRWREFKKLEGVWKIILET